MKVDLNLLKKLLVIDHPSSHEWPMISFIINECYKIKGLTFEMDYYSNIFITKNTNNPEYYPCVVSHMDCVPCCTHKELHIKNGCIYGRNRLTGKQIGLGADDANGICVALQLLKTIPDIKVCFTTEEEIGFNGATAASDNIDFFYNVSYLIQADRHGKSDLITFTNFLYVTSELWLQEATPVMVKYGYSEEDGLGTDIGVLAEKLQLSAVNISCGYYKEHTENEYTVIAELQNCLNFIYELITTIPYDIQYEIKVKYRPYNPLYGSTYSPYEPTIDDQWSHCNTCKDFDCMNCKWYP